MTDATPGNGKAELAAFSEALRQGSLVQRVVMMGGQALPDPASDSLSRGALKRILAEDDLPALDELEEEIARSHAEGRVRTTISRSVG